MSTSENEQMAKYDLSNIAQPYGFNFATTR